MSILDSVLTKEQKGAGFWVRDWKGPYFYSIKELYLERNGEILVTYPYCTVTIDQIRHDADQILNWELSGVTFERIK